MQIDLNYKEHILILGAGASVDYSLPVWGNLSNLIRNKVNNDKESKYGNKKEILNWLNKIGDDKKYKTIDECIKFESVSKEYHDNGADIENEIFAIIKDVFDEVYLGNDEGWILKLNEKIRENKEARIGQKLFFINYNYDDVLDKNFLNFDYLPEKLKELNYRIRLEELSRLKINCFHPHGFFKSNLLDSDSNHIVKMARTIKSNNKKYIDAVSCYESDEHTLTGQENLNLYILGLGGGLETNLNNIKFENPISEIHITIKNEKMKDKMINFLSDKFKIAPMEIKIYKDCNDLIDNYFVQENKNV